MQTWIAAPRLVERVVKGYPVTPQLLKADGPAAYEHARQVCCKRLAECEVE